MPKVAAAGGGHRHNNTTCSWSGRCRRGDLLQASLDGFGDSIQLGF